MWRRVLAIGAAWTGIVLLVAYRPNLSPNPRTVGWRLVEGARVRLERGRRYRACVRVPWIVPTSVVRNALPEKMAERGFRDVVVSSARPTGWPDVPCDLWVEATWDRDAEVFARPDAVPFGWERIET